jgi:hypothetical protein
MSALWAFQRCRGRHDSYPRSTPHLRGQRIHALLRNELPDSRAREVPWAPSRACGSHRRRGRDSAGQAPAGPSADGKTHQKPWPRYDAFGGPTRAGPQLLPMSKRLPPRYQSPSRLSRVESPQISQTSIRCHLGCTAGRFRNALTASNRSAIPVGQRQEFESPPPLLALLRHQVDRQLGQLGVDADPSFSPSHLDVLLRGEMRGQGGARIPTPHLAWGIRARSRQGREGSSLPLFDPSFRPRARGVLDFSSNRGASRGHDGNF